MTVLTVDLGTSATKVALWSDEGVVALTRAPVATSHPVPGRAEQDAHEWWTSFAAACAEVRATAPKAFAAVDALGFAAARETFVLVNKALVPLAPGILWSDRRAEEQVAALGDPAAFRAATGVMATTGAHAAKLAWLVDDDPELFGSARWILAPRDFIAARLTGVVVTDETLASRTGLCALGGWWLPEAVQRYRERLPEIAAAPSVVGEVLPDLASELGLPANVRVVIGAGDRACEVLGVGASARAPMVSWGTTANVSVPHTGPVDALPAVAQVSRGALGGFVVEAGLSAAGAAIAWLAGLTGRSHDDLLTAAADVPPGSSGVLALPWLAGARAPWWRADAHAAFLGLTEAHGPAELCRAMVEGVAFDVARCLDLVAPDAEELALAGGGAASVLWRSVVGSVSDRTVVRRTLDDAASVGARLIVASALGESVSVDDVNPVVAREEPDAVLVRAYPSLRATADASASAVISLN
ncbi:MAG: FGGY family carbohydrate kinase [Acidimicrobiia bacterium]